ncbi:MAG: methyltransferase [Proteobacteria bacterium]|nr:methyltransferase [Pseudomonadota bacterium]
MNDTAGRLPSTAEPAVGDALRLLCCPACGGQLRPAQSTRLACAVCGAAVNVEDGIVDFVAGGATTALDDIDYDARYAINIGASLLLYKVIVQAAGPRWPDGFGAAMEIGCGTGGFSMAFLSQADVGKVLLTDVSVKMLRICRERLQRMQSLLRSQRLAFATFSGTEACLTPASFDTCYGTAVLHHIADLKLVLSRIHALLKPGGRAFFMEPALPFHHALTATAADLVATWIGDGSVPEDELVRIANWLAEIHCNVANTGDIEVLAEREDKHQFVGAEFEAMATAVGFAVADALPVGPDPTGAETIGVYLSQLGLAETTLERVRQAWPAAQAGHFAALPPREQAPSYLFWLEKGRRRRPIRQQPTSVPPPLVLGEVPLRMWLELKIEQGDKGAILSAHGWCVAAEPVRAIELTFGRQIARLPVWLARLDVVRAVNAEGLYPNLQALCSGIDGAVMLVDRTALPVAIRVAAVAVAGGRLTVGSATLTTPGEAQTIHVSMRG